MPSEFLCIPMRTPVQSFIEDHTGKIFKELVKGLGLGNFDISHMTDLNSVTIRDWVC
jgi:hypothetical protein